MYALFDTALGPCGIAWSEAGVCALQLPEGTPDATRRRLLRRAPGATEGAPPAAVQAAIDAIVRLLGGEPVDLGFIELDLSAVPETNRRIYALARTIPPGATRTYGEIARELGDVALARAVGSAMGRNPFPIVVPCHRVLGANGALTGFSAHGGVATKRRMLEIEGVRMPHTPSLFADAGDPSS